MKKHLFLIITFISTKVIVSQIDFTVKYGTVPSTELYSTSQTYEGGFISAGYCCGGGSARDLYIIKSYPNGDIEWTNILKGITGDFATQIKQTNDTGFILAGHLTQTNPDLKSIIKLNKYGSPVWSKSYMCAKIISISQTTDNGYIFSANIYTNSSVTSNIYIVKTDALGDTLWTKIISGPASSNSGSIKQLADGNYIFTGSSSSGVDTDAILIKLSQNGTIIWSKRYNSTASTFYESGRYVIPTVDNGYIISGSTTGSSNCLIIKTDSVGNIIWSRAFGTNDSNPVGPICETLDTGSVFISSFYTGSGSSYKNNIMLIKLNKFGDFVWQVKHNFTVSCVPFDLAPTLDHGFIVCGSIGRGSAAGGGYDGLLIKTDSSGKSDCSGSSSFPTFTSIMPLTYTFTPNLSFKTGGTLTTCTYSSATGGTVFSYCSTIGVEESSNANFDSFKVFPNPNNGIFSLQVNYFSTNNLYLRLYDNIGNELLSTRVLSNNDLIDATTLSKGLYILKVTDNHQTIYTQKIILQ